MLDAWIRVDADGSDHRLHRQGRARPGHQDRADPGRGATSWRSRRARIDLVTADTARTPDEGVTAGSHSMQDSGTAILQRRGQCARSCWPKRRPGASASPPTRSNAATARRTRRTAGSVGYGELAAGAVAARRGPARRRRAATARHAGDRPEPAAGRHPGQGDRRRGLRAGHAPARHAACARACAAPSDGTG